jgi:hypothetical protein
MPENREHRRLVLALVREMLGAGITVPGAAERGWSRPPLIGGRRPDVVGFYGVGAAVTADEAKRSPELWAARGQLQNIVAALLENGPTESAPCSSSPLERSGRWTPVRCVAGSRDCAPPPWSGHLSDHG